MTPEIFPPNENKDENRRTAESKVGFILKIMKRKYFCGCYKKVNCE
jgi:hypothetical protein